ncbi:MAG: FKBP-type peptidyl-prolyl cis-trans isomerase [Bacteroidota bacterium]
MKLKITMLFALLLVSSTAINVFAQVAKSNKGKTFDYRGELKGKYDTIGYVIGANIGNNLQENITRDSLNLRVQPLMQGFIDALEDMDSTIFKKADKDKIMAAFQIEMQQRQQKAAEKVTGPIKAEGAKFLAENKTKPGVVTTASGLQYKVIKEGTGLSPKETDNVTVNYEGTFINGKKFDSSFDRGQPATFPLNGVIKGWTEGLQHMKEGGSYELYIPYDLGYGEQGTEGIPGGSTLIFKVDLIKVEAAKK